MRRRTISKTDEVKLRDLVQQGASAAHFSEFVSGSMMGEQERQIRTKIFQVIDSEEPLDPMLAVQSWIELRAVYKLVARLNRMSGAGIAAQKALDGTPSEAE